MAIGDGGGREHGVSELLGFVLSDMEGAALVATDGVRARELIPVEGDEQTAVEVQQGVEIAVGKDSTEAEGTCRQRRRGRDRRADSESGDIRTFRIQS